MAVHLITLTVRGGCDLRITTMATRKLSRFVPRDKKWLVACLIAVSVVDSVVRINRLYVIRL